MKLSTADIDFAMNKIGVVTQKGLRRVFGYVEVDGRRSIPVSYPDRQRTLGGFAQANIEKQLHLDTTELTGLVECRVSREEFYEMLHRRL